MQLYSECMHCIVEHHWSLCQDCPDEARKAAFMREVCRTVAEADPDMAAPVPTAKLQKIYAAHFDERDNYPDLKRKYNELVASWLPELRAALAAADDPFKLAVWMAMAGNYIDFGILKEDRRRAPQAHALHAGRKGRGHARRWKNCARSALRRSASSTPATTAARWCWICC